MATAAQVEAVNALTKESVPMQPYYAIRDLAERWRCSRGSVYSRLRGELVVDFAAKGKKGHKLVPLAVVLKIERACTRVLR